MKRFRFILLGILLFATIPFTKSQSEIPIQNISTDSNAVYRLFATRNMYTFIKLNTSNGTMSQVQWGLGELDGFETTLSDISLVDEKKDEINGRFFLYPTSNFYTFILLDQIDGRAWQVQWGFEEKDRGLIYIISADDLEKIVMKEIEKKMMEEKKE